MKMNTYRARRERLGMTAVELASRAGIGRDTLRGIERGESHRTDTGARLNNVLTDAERDAGIDTSLDAIPEPAETPGIIECSVTTPDGMQATFTGPARSIVHSVAKFLGVTLAALMLAGCASDSQVAEEPEAPQSSATPSPIPSPSPSPTEEPPPAVEGGMEEGSGLTTGMIAEGIGCQNMRLTSIDGEVECKVNGSEVTITDWSVSFTDDERDQLLEALSGLGSHGVLIDDRITVGSEDRSVVEDAKAQYGGKLVIEP